MPGLRQPARSASPSVRSLLYNRNLRYPGWVPPEAGEDTRVWIGRVSSGHEADHEHFVQWLNGAEAESIFRRRRLTEYQLNEDRGTVTVVFKALHTGDPRIMIDFLRYPGLWPDYWEFVRGGRGEDESPVPGGSVRVHWKRGDQTHVDH
jgi:hypothetical protein